MAATKQCGRGLRGRSPPSAGLGGSLRGGLRGKVAFGELTEICRFFLRSGLRRRSIGSRSF